MKNNTHNSIDYDEQTINLKIYSQHTDKKLIDINLPESDCINIQIEVEKAIRKAEREAINFVFKKLKSRVNKLFKD